MKKMKKPSCNSYITSELFHKKQRNYYKNIKCKENSIDFKKY